MPDVAPTSFSALPVHPVLAAALVARGYETATPVQAAVLAPGLAENDLLVSAPTGSGKTVAFGTLLAETLLTTNEAPDPGTEPGDRLTRPARGLIVAPTRELAVQVCRELEWLFAGAHTRVASFTGGTEVGRDLKKLRGGIDLIVGTPGRLVDLHRRQALDLSAVSALVLDEADEMLDLGFKEDLEYLLAGTPPGRRTLLFSATLPSEIQRLATTYMRAPVRIDPRSGGAKQAHADITYVAHLVRPHDRLAAVVNVLLAAGDAKAIVFVKTREGVGGLQQRLIDHGFRAAAIAGDRAQGERDRALEALRGGKARVLVATNVAARGLDLPDVDLVVHADLPENAESLTHRSGRTGRAGKKGTSVVIAAPSERRKAERLLDIARVGVRFTAPPTANDVRRVLLDRLVDALLKDAKTMDEDGDGDGALEAMTTRLRAALPEDKLLSLLLRREAGRLPPPMKLEALDPARRESAGHLSPHTRDGGERPGRDGYRGPAGGPGRNWTRAVVFRVNLGAQAKAEPGWLLPLICRRGGVTRQEVGSIRVGPQSSTFEIAEHAANDFLLAARETDPRAPHVLIEALQPGAPPASHRSPHRSPPPKHAPHAPHAPHKQHRHDKDIPGGKPPKRRRHT